MVAPVALVTLVEHLGDITTISATVGQDFIQDPGFIERFLAMALQHHLQDSLEVPSNTTYSENTGVLAVTKVFDPVVMRIAAIFALTMSIFGKFGALLSTIPEPVMGGISIILFGMIASIGMRVMVENRIDFSSGRNMLIAAFVLTIGMMSVLGEANPAVVKLGVINLEGLSLATIVGIMLNPVLPEEKPAARPKASGKNPAKRSVRNRQQGRYSRSVGTHGNGENINRRIAKG